MSQPNYKLKDDHVATVKHMRDERARNEDTYDKKTDLLRIQRLVGVTSAIDAVEFNANGNNSVIKKYGVRENGLLAYDQVPAWQNVTSLVATKADSADVYNKTEVNNALVLKRNVADSYSKTETDNSLALKANQSTTYTKTEVDNSLALKRNVADSYSKTEVDNALTLKKNTGTFDAKIEHTSGNSAIDCSDGNKIDLKVNGANRGYIFQPTGQATTPLGIVSMDKLQLQSELSATSIYGSKPLSSDGSVNTHGVYIGGIDDPAKNVQSTLNVYQGNAQVYLAAGHYNPGSGMTDYCALSANGTLQLSGGLLPGISDKQLLLYGASKNQAIPLQADAKMGYTPAANVAITEATQFTSKKYVDDADALRLPLSGGTLTGALTLSGPPTENLHSASKQYVDSQFAGAGTGDFKANGTVVMTGSLNMGTTNKIINLAEPTDPSDATSKSYVDSKTSALSDGALKLVDNNQTDGNKYELKIDNNELQFRRGATSDDTWLKLFGSTKESSDGVVQQTNRNNWFYESEDSTGLVNRIWLNHTVDATPDSTYQKSAPLRITQGTTGTQPFCQISALSGITGGTNNSLTMYPENTLTSSITNKTQISQRMGYTAGAPLSLSNDQSILQRSELDARYVSKTASADLAMNAFRITNISDGLTDVDVVSKGYVDGKATVLQKNIDDILTGTSIDFLTPTEGDARYHRSGQNMPMGNFKITGLGEPTTSTDAATLFTVTNITDQKMDISERTNYIRTNGGSTIMANIPFNDKRITGLANPVGDQDAATRSWTLGQIATSTGTPTNIQNGTYRCEVLEDGRLRFYDVQAIGGGLYVNASDAKIPQLYSSYSAIGAGLQLQSHTGNDISAIQLRRTVDQALPIIVVGKMGYFSGSETIDQPTQFVTKKWTEDYVKSQGIGTYSTLQIQQNFARTQDFDGYAKSSISAFSGALTNLDMNFWRIDELGDAIVDRNAVNWKQVKENRTWVARLSLGDPSSGVPSVIASTNSFITSIVKTSSDGVSALYTINFNATNCPEFIKTGTYLPTATVIAPLSTEGTTTFTWLNDTNPIVCGSLSSSSMQIFWEQTVNVNQITNLMLSITNLNIA